MNLHRGLVDEETKQPCELVKNYPYAVDGLEIWNAINKWVKEYCDIYYKGEDKKVQNDKEIQNWWKEIKEVGHGDKKEYDGWPEMKTFDELVESCTIIIWISSALHAAVNFGQYSFAAFYPNRPTLSRQFMPTEGTTLGADDEESYFFLEMIYLIAQLSSHESDEVYLGKNEDVDWTSDKKALDAFKIFKHNFVTLKMTLRLRIKIMRKIDVVRFNSHTLCSFLQVNQGLRLRESPIASRSKNSYNGKIDLMD
ncbi:hypothetical protein F8388_024222 [Cannabis sativa]|uniref:Lipoxygenase domain-containing protein n=1 Tax=Cannabis sativa TaxID=3483 RepID=A0A7J6DT37_CANSA|nr:hypothetical protein F8388_024222 [Cannabis sativa]